MNINNKPVTPEESTRENALDLIQRRNLSAYSAMMDCIANQLFESQDFQDLLDEHINDRLETVRDDMEGVARDVLGGATISIDTY